MIGFIWSHLGRNAGRSVALLSGVLVATTGFTVLTATTATSRLTVAGTVDDNAQAAYDILVRPKGARTPLEVERGLVRPNYLSGLFGGLTMRQYEQVKAIQGVDVAAPIAMIGYANGSFNSSFDITDLIDRNAARQLIRVDPTFRADRGMSQATGQPTFVYVIKGPLSWRDWGKSESTANLTFTGGEVVRDDKVCGGNIVALDHGADGRPVPICSHSFVGELTTDRQIADVDVVRLRPDGTFERGTFVGGTTDRLRVDIPVHLPFLLAGVDPVAEDRLVGLGDAVDAGRYLTPTDALLNRRSGPVFPVLSSNRSYIDSTTSVAISALPPDAQIAGVPRGDLLAALGAMPTRPLGQRVDDGEQNFQNRLGEMLRRGSGPVEAQHLVQTGSTQYERAPDGTLVALTVASNPEAYRTPGVRGLIVPWQIDDTAFRTLTQVPAPGTGIRDTTLVGTFDPSKLTGFSELSRVPMETYEPPGVTGADQRTRDLLGGKALVPNGNASGYLASPPLLLTNLTLVPDLLRGTGSPAADAPISAIRIRVAGVHGFSKASRERVRIVAEQIAVQTGLDVDITYGSSAAPQTVKLAPGIYDRPALTVTEPWSKKGVATIVTNAIDRKSAILFVLVLIVCALFLTNAVSAAVRNRRRELAILACMGWPRHRIGLAILAEVLTLGAVAGLLSLALSTGLGALLGVHLAWSHALLAVPVALGLTLVAGTAPALRASRAHPAAALHPPVAKAFRTRRAQSVLGLGLVNLTRVPARTLLGAVSLAIGVAGLTVLAAAAYAFNGAIVGTVLGDAVSVRVRGVDTIAVVATVVLGALAVADVLYLNIRDRASELATLQAAGWNNHALTRLVTYEGLGMGLLGATLGATLGLTGAALLVGGLTSQLVTTSVIAALAGTVIAGVAALIPALVLRRQPIAHLLAEE